MKWVSNTHLNETCAIYYLTYFFYFHIMQRQTSSLPLWIVRICWATTESTSKSILLNSSKQAQAPQDKSPWEKKEQWNFSMLSDPVFHWNVAFFTWYFMELISYQGNCVFTLIFKDSLFFTTNSLFYMSKEFIQLKKIPLLFFFFAFHIFFWYLDAHM